MVKAPDNYYRADRAEMVHFLPKEYTRVLEIGCAEGGFSKYLKDSSEIWGCESNEDAALAASDRISKVLVGKYDQVVENIPNEYFDLVICNDVIEHMEDHDWFFDSISNKIRSDGFLVGSIPNVRHIRNLYSLIILKDWQYQDFLTLDRTHLRWFTKKSLLRTLAQHNFHVEEFQGINGTAKRLFKIFFFIFNVLTLGQHSDIQHVQFAFRVRKSKHF
jgi:2-polyprenyl-3-methyl-5-hydroxy-6-metoxy-1,4-benzoquinol methylase